MTTEQEQIRSLKQELRFAQDRIMQVEGLLRSIAFTRHMAGKSENPQDNTMIVLDSLMPTIKETLGIVRFE